MSNAAPEIPKNVMPTWVMPVVKLGAVAIDAMLATFSFLAAFYVREGDPIIAPGSWSWSPEFAPYSGILMFAVPARLVMLIYQRAYRFDGAFSYSAEAIRFMKAATVSSLLTIAWAFLFRGGFAYREFSYSRSIFIADFVISLFLIGGFHFAIRRIQASLRERGINLIPTMIVGTSIEAVQTVRELADRKYLGYKVIGLVATGDKLSAPSGLAGVIEIPVVGHVDDLNEQIVKYKIQEVIITDDSFSGDRLFEAMMKLGRHQRVEFRFAPNLFNVLPQKTSVDQIGVLPMVRLFREPLTDVQRFTKRLSDIILAIAAGIVTLPIWLAAAILVRVDSKGPLIYRQERVGMDGRVFLCLKFRSMKIDADDAIHREAYRKNIVGDAGANAGDEASPVYGKVKDDPRITRVGKFLRRTSIDELPQLLNVLRGEMSIVGPRPPIPYEVEEYDIWHRKRLDMKPGITCLWQVSGRNRLTFDEMVKIDLYYIENWSLLLDAKIILLTIPAVFRGDGAR